MLSDDDLARIREERETLETWRTISRHVVAQMLEACAVCGMVREKDRLAHCRWCQDLYYCQIGSCRRKHEADYHPGIAFKVW